MNSCLPRYHVFHESVSAFGNFPVAFLQLISSQATPTSLLFTCSKWASCQPLLPNLCLGPRKHFRPFCLPSQRGITWRDVSGQDRELWPGAECARRGNKQNSLQHWYKELASKPPWLGEEEWGPIPEAKMKWRHEHRRHSDPSSSSSE